MREYYTHNEKITCSTSIAAMIDNIAASLTHLTIWVIIRKCCHFIFDYFKLKTSDKFINDEFTYFINYNILLHDLFNCLRSKSVIIRNILSS